MMGNYHVRFLGGKGVVTPLTYPVSPCDICYRREIPNVSKVLRYDLQIFISSRHSHSI